MLADSSRGFHFILPLFYPYVSVKIIERVRACVEKGVCTVQCGLFLHASVGQRI